MKKGEKRQVKTGEVIICMSVFVVLSDAFREGWRVAGHAIRKAVKGNYLNFGVLDDWVAGSQVMHHDRSLSSSSAVLLVSCFSKTDRLLAEVQMWEEKKIQTKEFSQGKLSLVFILYLTALSLPKWICVNRNNRNRTH